MTIDVVGIGDAGLATLPPGTRELVLGARVLLGGRRHLDALPPADGQERIPWPTPLRAGLPALLRRVAPQAATPGAVVVLASGDPLRSGVGTTLIGLLGAHAVRVHPFVSSATLARARMGWPAEECAVVTLVGRGLDLLRRHLDPGARLVLLCSNGDTPAEIAGLLAAEGCGASRMTAWWHLGGPLEGHRAGTAGQWGSAPTPDLVVVCVEVDRSGALARAALGTAPGLPEAAFDTDGQITKRDVRASALAHLRPWRGGLLWDLGAGSGSVAIEWARAAEGAKAVAVERDPVRAERILGNAHRLGVPRTVEVVAADVLDAVRTGGLADPDAVFVGGGLTQPLLDAVWERLRPGCRLVVHAVTLGSEAVLVAGCERLGGELTRIAVERAAPLGGRLSWAPSRAVVQWSVTRPGP